jgi:hypothetical protein
LQKVQALSLKVVVYFTLSDLITDIAQNGTEAGAAFVELSVSETFEQGGKSFLHFCVKDNGKGMSEIEMRQARHPFVTDGIKHPDRKVGLGLPFLIQTAEQSGGGWKMGSKKKPAVPAGTTVSAWFDLGNVDTPPKGDISGMFRTVLLFSGPDEVLIKRVKETFRGRVDYEVRKSELVDALGSLENSQSLILLDKYLRSLEESEDINNINAGG